MLPRWHFKLDPASPYQKQTDAAAVRPFPAPESRP
uniref:Uncharacterized protein n=1 Tax=Arundo donax TaxID=35708 RepID=A0A0A9B8R0_ARUDO